VAYVDKDPKKGSIVTIANLDRLPMPAIIVIEYADGSTTAFRLPVATWFKKKSIDLKFDSTAEVTKVTVDPDHALPDKNRANNIFPRQAR
jgi:hypothetical protein